MSMRFREVSTKEGAGRVATQDVDGWGVVQVIKGVNGGESLVWDEQQKRVAIYGTREGARKFHRKIKTNQPDYEYKVVKVLIDCSWDRQWRKPNYWYPYDGLGTRINRWVLSR